MLQESSIRRGLPLKRCRGISTAIAGLIVLTFLLVVAVPLLLNIYSGSVQSHLALSNELARKLQAVSQNVNITYDPASSSPPSLRVYIVENNGPSDAHIEFYVVTDGAKTYLVKAVNTYNQYFPVKDMEVETEPVSASNIVGNYIVLKAPLGKALVRVVNGKLLGAILATGNYIHVNTPGVTGATATYAEVAASIKTNYINLTTFSSLTGLFNDPNIIIATNPAANQSNSTLLNQGAFQTICFTGTNPDDPSGGVSGGFQPTVDSEQVNAVYIHNLGIWPGSIVLGGRSTDYSANSIRFSLYMAGYSLIAYNTSEPGFLAITTANDGNALCYSFVFSDGYVISDCMPEGSITWASSFISYALYKTMAGKPQYGTSYVVSDTLNTVFNTVYSGKLGLLFWNNNFVAYCPPGSFHLSTTSGEYVFNVTGTCWFAERWESYWDEGAYEGIISTGSTLTVTSPQEIFGDNDVGIKGEAKGNVRYVIEYMLDANPLEVNDNPDFVQEFPQYPSVIKLTYLAGDKNLLSIYDNTAGRIKRGVNAFGVYLYGGEYLVTESGTSYVYYYVHDLYGEDGYISTFQFQLGTTSGLRPYMILADTDGNGLTELVLIDEWFSPDYYYHTHTDLSDLVGAGDIRSRYSYHPAAGLIDTYVGYGCIAKTLGYFYIKFGGQYAVNGSQIAEVSVQIRFSFHDNVAGDVDEVDNSTTGLWGFALVNSNGTEISNSLYNYQQLAPLEDTWPISMPFQSQSVYLPVPDKPELYYVVFKFGDPYSYVYSARKLVHDDVDMTVRVEWLGIWYLHR